MKKSSESYLKSAMSYPQAIIAVRPSLIVAGEAGVFAIRALPPEAIVANAEDWDESVIISWAMFRQLDPVTKKRLRMFCWQSPEGIHAPRNINQLTIPWHINHSCMPNLYIDRDGNYRTLQRVKKGSELSIDIGTIMTDPAYRLKCRCGLPNCVRIIRPHEPGQA